MATAQRSRTASFIAGLILVLGVALLAGGLWLALLGGSSYYIVAAAGLMLTAVLLLRRLSAAWWVFALLLAATLAWAVWEVGFDWWQLAARLDVLFVLGLVLLLPPLTHSVGYQPPQSVVAAAMGRERPVPRLSWRSGAGAALTTVLVVAALVGAVSALRDPYDRAGSLPPSRGQLTNPDAAMRGVPPGDWWAYGRTADGQRYSPLASITPANVASLQLAWQYRTGDERGRAGDPVETTDEVTPLKVGDRLFLCTPHQSVIALDAITGNEIWRTDLKVQPALALQHLTCRGLAYQPPAAAAAPVAQAPASAPESAASAAPGSADPGQPVAAQQGRPAADCAAKLFMATADGRLVALDPANGAVCSRFGGGSGQVDLWAHMPNLLPGSYYSTSPAVVTARLVIVGGTVIDNLSTHEQSGVIRAFDIETGALVWNWDSGNPDETAPIASGKTYTVNSPNSWSISAVDEQLGLLYVPMGNQPPDQWGGKRSAAVERYSSSVVALDLATGKPRWVFQTVHHDLWDYDVPAQPSLLDLTIDGRSVPALVQPTKQGEIFVLDRRNGTPLLPVTEVSAPQGAAQGDHTAATQPMSALSFNPPPLTGSDMWGATMFDQLYCRIAFHRLRYQGRFTPPSTEGSLIYPGNFGVFNWGSIAVDPMRQVAFTMPTSLAFVSRLVPRPDDVTMVVQDNGPPKGSLPALNENFGAPFAVELKPFVSPLGVPCQAPPWGAVAGVDLTTGKIAWRHRNGTVRDLSPLPLPFKMGVPGLGGPVMTAGGVAFLSGTLDNFVRAYDVSDGRQLWESRLPAGGQATPMTYSGSDGRQYLLVVAGGHGSTGTTPGDYVRAYALPKP